MFATSIISSLGAITLAASEIMRQVFIISMQSFTALDISSQALVASYLGKVGPRPCLHPAETTPDLVLAMKPRIAAAQGLHGRCTDGARHEPNGMCCTSRSQHSVWMGLQGDRAAARDVLLRTVQLGLLVGAAVGSLIFCCRGTLPILFSSDPAVRATAARALPVLAVFMVIRCLLAFPAPSQAACVASMLFIVATCKVTIQSDESYAVQALSA